MYGITVAQKMAANVGFLKALDSQLTTQPWRDCAMVAPSSGAAETYQWLGDFPGVSEFLDERQVKGLKECEYLITNKTYETTVGFKVDELNDNIGIIQPRLAGAAVSMANHPNSLVFAAIVAGNSALCFDGQAFFSASHPVEDQGNFSNMVTATGQTAALISADFNTARQRLLSFKNRAGDPLFAEVGKLVIYCSPDLMAAMEQVFTRNVDSNGATNTLFGAATVKALGYLSGNTWYLAKVDHPMKPIVFQERESVKTDWDETQVFMKGKVFFGGRGRYNVGYGFWQLMLRVA